MTRENRPENGRGISSLQTERLSNSIENFSRVPDVLRATRTWFKKLSFFEGGAIRVVRVQHWRTDRIRREPTDARPVFVQRLMSVRRW